LKRHKVTLIPGDGTGPELTDATRRCVDATGVTIDWEVGHAGVDVMEKEKTPLPEKVLDSIRKNKVALKGPITTPIGTGIRSVNVSLRKTLNLYACVRPCKSFAGVKSAFKDIDLVIIRENTEDLYAGVEFAVNTPEAKKLLETIGALSPVKILNDSAISIKPISVTGSKRIVDFAFRYAIAHNRKKVTCVHKANIMKYSDGLFLQCALEVAERYKDSGVAFEDKLVDNMCMQLVQKPNLYDVLVLPNLYGDILSDLCAGLVGGLGVAPGANIGDDIALFEPTHGSAPKYKGLNKVNPVAMIFSAVMMLEHIDEKPAARLLEKAVAMVLEENKRVTYDVAHNASSIVGTKETADEIIAKIKTLRARAS